MLALNATSLGRRSTIAWLCINSLLNVRNSFSDWIQERFENFDKCFCALVNPLAKMGVLLQPS